MLKSLFKTPIKWISVTYSVCNHWYHNVFDPFIDFIKPAVFWIGRKYKWGFEVLSTDKSGEISTKRAAFIAVPTLAAVTWFTVFTLIPETWDGIVDVAGLLTERDEHVFLTGASPLEGDTTEQYFRAKGCDHLPCTSDNGTYYHIRPNGVKTLIDLVTKGELYLPETVEAAIPDQLSECTVAVQWFRLRIFKIYNTITEVSCIPIVEDRTKKLN